MRELKLKYVIELLSNIDRKAGDDAKALATAQKRIQDELQRTGTKVGALERLLLRLHGSGAASAERQAQVLARLAVRYQDLRRAAEGAGVAMQRAATAGASVAAGAYAADRVTRAPMDYSLRLAYMANTAYPDRNTAGRLQGKAALDAAIRAAVRTGGGSRDQAAEALDALVASGSMPVEVAIRMLPSLMRGSTASGASPQELGMIGVRAMQAFQVPIERIPEVLNMAMAAGQAGGFELKDMARWLPQAMAAGSTAGLTGVEGLRRIVASMQASTTTAGTKDEAGNNLVNLLAKINSRDTAVDFEKQGVDLTARLAEAQSKGVNALDAFVSLVDEIASRDKDFVALKGRLAQSGSTGERAQVMQSMAAILQGKAIGQVVQDRQALMALIAEMNGRDYIASVMARTRSDTGAIGSAFDLVSRETSFSRQGAANEVAFAGDTAWKQVGPVFDAIYSSGSRVAQEFPTLTAAVVGATGALGVFTAALGAGSLVGVLGGAKGGWGLAGTAAAGALATAAPVAGAVAAGGFAAWNGWRLGDALSQLYEAKTREGVTLSRSARERLGMAMPAGATGPGLPAAPDALSVSAPGQPPSWLQQGQQRELKIGEGRLAVDVRVHDDRVSATANVAQPMSLVRINPGHTNPGGY